MVKQKVTGRATSIPSGLAVGALASVASTVVVSFIGAQLIMSEMIDQDKIGYCILAALLAGTILGAIAASSKIKHRKILICMMSGGVYLSILLAATALFFGGEYEGIFATAITILIGAASAAILTGRRGRCRN